MKLLISCLLAIIIAINADPGVLIVSRESQPLSGNDYQSQRLNNVGAIQPKTIIISNVGNSGDDQSSSGADSTGNPMRDVIMNVIHSQLRQAAAEANGTDGNGIPEMVFTDPEQHISGQQQQQQQQPQQQRPQQQPALTAGAGIIERVYTMPATTRLIRTEQQSDGQSDAKHFYIPFRSASKASASMWRSPLPFFRQPMGGEGHPCQHGMNGMRRQRKGRNMRRRAMRQRMRMAATPDPEPTTTTTEANSDDQSPMRSLLAHLLAKKLATAATGAMMGPFMSMAAPESPKSGPELSPLKAIIMSITRTEPFGRDNSPSIPFPSPLSLPFMSISRHPTGDEDRREMFGSSAPKIPAFLRFLISKLGQRRAAEAERRDVSTNHVMDGPHCPFMSMIRRKIAEKKARLAAGVSPPGAKNFNFHINLTVNNNYGDNTQTRPAVRAPMSTRRLMSPRSAFPALFPQFKV